MCLASAYGLFTNYYFFESRLKYTYTFRKVRFKINKIMLKSKQKSHNTNLSEVFFLRNNLRENVVSIIFWQKIIGSKLIMVLI